MRQRGESGSLEVVVVVLMVEVVLVVVEMLLVEVVLLVVAMLVVEVVGGSRRCATSTTVSEEAVSLRGHEDC